METKEKTVNGKDPPITPLSKHGNDQGHHPGHSLLKVFVLVTGVYCLLYLGENRTLGGSQKLPYPGSRTVALTQEKRGKCFPEEKNPLVHVQDSRTYLVASYVEQRSRPSKVRTIAIVKRTEYVGYFCTFCCDDALRNSSATYEIHSDNFGFDYGTADIMCLIPKNCSMPTHVAVYKGPLGPQKLQFLPIHNQHEQYDSFPYQFTICISVMYEYANVLQLVQTLEMFKLLGAHHVAIYQSSCNGAAQRVLDHYVQEGFVEIIPWPITKYLNASRGWQPSVSPGDVHYFGQIAALNDCVYRFMYQTKYIVLQDLDELIVPLRMDSWVELLPLLEQKYGVSTSFEFENNVFRNTWSGRNAAQRPKEWRGVPGVDILDHVWREPNDPNAFNNFKVIVNPRTVYSTSVHGLLSADSSGVRVDRNVARMYHIREPYRMDVTTEDLITDERLWDFAPRLIPAVSDVLNKTFPK
ncbi:hypothetical protein ACEWY4_008719 [Coilia grayii]|uniref:Glycosyltransferase family 92 protein n=1 Tax=Coilia grayii TaxID=363190 RepID=A0ABD1KC30_9TELE